MLQLPLSVFFFSFFTVMTFDLSCGNECGLCLAVFRGKNCLLMSVSDEKKKNGSKIECYDVHILKCAEQTSSCTSRRALSVWEGGSGTPMNFCGIFGLAIVHNTRYGVLNRLNQCQWSNDFTNLQKTHEIYTDIRATIGRLAHSMSCEDKTSDNDVVSLGWLRCL